MTLNVDLTFTGPVIGEVRCTGTIGDEEPPVRPGELVSDWLAHIDPKELERVTWEAHEASGGGDYTPVLLAVLRRWASGNP